MIARVFTVIVIVAGVICNVSAFDSRNILFIILSQEEPYHASVAARLKGDIENQINYLEKRLPKVLMTHQDYNIPGSWTIKPLLGPIASEYKHTDVRWVVFVESHTAVRSSILLEALRTSDSQKHIGWLGYPLNDEEPTIIHHFSMYEELDEEEGGFVYPYFASGFAMRIELISSLASMLESRHGKTDESFAIDPSYELAQFVFGDSRNRGPLLSPEMSFCVISGENCATYPRHFDVCGSSIREDHILFAVKTWSGFHATRVKVVKKTWGRHVSNLMFFSDKADPSIPTIDLEIPNTKSGHCAKTIAILKYLVDKVKNMPHIKWIFLADDDTILGAHRLCEVLSCYRGGEDVTILGERYGYGYSSGSKHSSNKGYDYITGGGGIALSVGGARALSTCVCVTPHSPDDMTLGACATIRLNLTLTHSPLFHQARPQDYPREVVARDRPVSFHKHSSPEPLKVYATWFQHEDLALRRRKDEL